MLGYPELDRPSEKDSIYSLVMRTNLLCTHMSAQIHASILKIIIPLCLFRSSIRFPSL